MAYPIFMLQSLANVKILLYDMGCQMERVMKVIFFQYRIMIQTLIFPCRSIYIYIYIGNVCTCILNCVLKR